jgi:hypothetical protein
MKRYKILIGVVVFTIIFGLTSPEITKAQESSFDSDDISSILRDITENSSDDEDNDRGENRGRGNRNNDDDERQGEPVATTTAMATPATSTVPLEIPEEATSTVAAPVRENPKPLLPVKVKEELSTLIGYSDRGDLSTGYAAFGFSKTTTRTLLLSSALFALAGIFLFTRPRRTAVYKKKPSLGTFVTGALPYEK